MIARTLLHRPVCLQCQLRLFARPGPPSRLLHSSISLRLPRTRAGRKIQDTSNDFVKEDDFLSQFSDANGKGYSKSSHFQPVSSEPRPAVRHNKTVRSNTTRTVDMARQMLKGSFADRNHASRRRHRPKPLQLTNKDAGIEYAFATKFAQESSSAGDTSVSSGRIPSYAEDTAEPEKIRDLDDIAPLQAKPIIEATEPKEMPKIWKISGRRATVSAQVGVAALGEKIDALIVRDVKEVEPERRRKSKRVGKVHVPVTPIFETNTDDISAFIEDAREEASDEEAIRNISELKPRDGMISEDEFENIRGALLNGFTTPQIKQYIRWVRMRDGKSKAKPDTLKGAPWVLQPPQWVPLTPESDNEGHITQKEALVLHILNDLWEVPVQQALSENGYLDIKLREAEFGLLLVGTSRWINYITRTYLKTGGHMEAFKSTRTMRIVAPKPKAEAILGEIYSLLKDVTCGIIPLKELPEDFEADTQQLSELGRLTNTYIRYDEVGNEIHVHYVELSDRDTHWESLRDTVRRFLLSAHYCPPTSTSRIAVLNEDKLNETKYKYVSLEDDTNKLSWSHRLRNWSRWQARLQEMEKSYPPFDESGPQISPLSNLPWPLGSSQAPLLSSESQVQERGSNGWSMEEMYSTQVVFGHVLHPDGPGVHLHPPRSSEDITPDNRQLSPVMPPLRSLSELDKDQKRNLIPGAVSCLIMKFLPRMQPYKKHLRPPPIELRFAATDIQILDPISLRAIVGESTSDILFPGSQVDARIIQERYYDLDPNMLTALESLQEFLSHSRLDLQNGKLNTPSQLGLAVPASFCFHERATKRSKEKADGDEKPKRAPKNRSKKPVELIDVQYTFAGMEFHRQATIEYPPTSQSVPQTRSASWEMTPTDAWLAYTSIEAGKSGGHQARLSLIPNIKGRDGADKDIKKSFLGHVYDIATSRTLAWVQSESVVPKVQVK